MMLPVISLVLVSHVVHLSNADCFRSRGNIMLQRHVIRSLSIPHIGDCWQECAQNTKCQSLNYFVKMHLCEINNRTMDFAPHDAVVAQGVTYFENPFRVAVGTAKSVPAVSCAEILQSVGNVSGRYWLIDHAQSGVPFKAYCNMSTLAIENCPLLHCENGGICNYFGLGAYECVCPIGTSGQNCSVILECVNALGMQSRAIPDSSITASSIYDDSYKPWYGRLHNPTKCWSPKPKSAVEWIKVDLGKTIVVGAVATQGSPTYGEWVTSYSLEYSLDGSKFESYGKDFMGNSDQNSVVKNDIRPPVKTRFIKLIVKSGHSYFSMRMELYGCSI